MNVLPVLRVSAAVLVGGWVLVCVLMYVFQDALVYFPARRIAQTPAAIGLPFDDVTLDTADGERLGAWYVTAPSSRGVVLFCHGNAGNIGDRVSTVAILAGLGVDVLMFDYRGYGASSGKPSEDGLYADARAAWRYLVETRGIAPDRIVIMGRSLGGGVAIWLASQVEAAGLIAESTFSSAVDLAAELYPLLPVSLLARHRFESIGRIADIGEPVLVAHSPDDTMIGAHHGKRLLAAASEPKRFLALAGGHNDTVVTTGAVYESGLDAFLTDVLGPRPGVQSAR